MGMAAVKDTVLGTVTERVVRRLTKADTLIVKDLDRSPFEHIVVAVDGSAKSLGGLKRAIELAREFGGTVEAISVFDPYFHYAMFHSIAGVLSSKAQKVFRFKEQEKLHEEIIDSGLAKIYTAHLEVAKKIAEDEGVDLKTTLLAGKPFEQTLKYVNEVNPTLVVMGRIGYHSDDEMDIGGNTENMMRYLPTNVLVGNYEYQAPDLYTAEEHMTWTDEALQRLDRIPGFVVGMATGRDHPLRHREGLHGNNDRRHRRGHQEHPPPRRHGVDARHRRPDARGRSHGRGEAHRLPLQGLRRAHRG
jgi:nucleotide-binding universal stress UspA family protein